MYQLQVTKVIVGIAASVALWGAVATGLTWYYHSQYTRTQKSLQDVTRDLVRAEAMNDNLTEQVQRGAAELKSLKERKQNVDSQTTAAKQELARIRQDNAGSDNRVLPAVASRLRTETERVRTAASAAP